MGPGREQKGKERQQQGLGHGGRGRHLLTTAIGMYCYASGLPIKEQDKQRSKKGNRPGYTHLPSPRGAGST